MALDIGVMFTATDDLAATLSELQRIGIHHGQMAIPGEMPLDGKAELWAPILAETGFRLHTLIGVYPGESYTDIPTVQRTVGFVPETMRAERERRTLEIVGLAAALHVPGFATHIGFIPEDTSDLHYFAVREMVRRIADAAARHGITFALETGQETASALLDFLIDINRENVGVNFDPANMILYGTGNPIDALETVGQHVFSVHAKDGDWPPSDVPGALGTEKPIGQGSVNFPAFLTILHKIGYEGPLFIEREVSDVTERLRDIQRGKAVLETLLMAV